jgi:hypothetical protein
MSKHNEYLKDTVNDLHKSPTTPLSPMSERK